jgi:hypothetical protein
MKNVTLAIDEELLTEGRRLAASRHTTLNALVRTLLAEEIAQDARIADARQGLKDLIAKSTANLGSDFKWNREEIYAEREDRLLSRLEHPDLRGGRKDR